MNKIDQKLSNYLIKQAPDMKTADWINDSVSSYENLVRCHSCNSESVEIIADIKVVVKCKECGQFTSENISLDRIPTINYNDVEFLQEKKIIEILEAQGKI